MKILFVFPNFNCPLGISIGISYIASALKSNGHSVRVIHISERIGYPYDDSRIVEDVKQINPDILLFSIGENHYNEMKKIGRLVKNELNVPIGFGGIHVTLNADRIIEENDFLDYCILHDGEESVVELVNKLDSKNSVKSIKGIYVRENNKIYKNKIYKQVDISKLKYMELDIWEFEKITKLRRGWVNVSLNRGCPYRCSFCHNEGVSNVLKSHLDTKNNSNKELGYLRLRDPKDMINELKKIKEKYNFIKAFSFIDDTFTMDKVQIVEFLKMYEKEIKLPFVCNTTVVDADSEVLDMLRLANCSLVRFGVESITQRIKKNFIKRNFPNEKIISTFKYCRSIGLKYFSYNIIAHPTETKEEILNTLVFNARLKPDGIRLSLGYPYPGTQYYNIAYKLNMIDEKVESNNYSTESKFKWDLDMKLWIDKCKTIYWWYINKNLCMELEEIYFPLIKFIESLSLKDWEKIKNTNCIKFLDKSMSEEASKEKIIHYKVMFDDRPDIVLLETYDEILKPDVIDEHVGVI